MENDGVGGQPGCALKKFLEVVKHVVRHMVHMHCMSINGDMHALYDSTHGVLQFELLANESDYDGYEANIIDTYLGPMRVANALIGMPSRITFKADCYVDEKFFSYGSMYIPRSPRWMQYAVQGFHNTEVTLRLMCPTTRGRRRWYKEDTHWDAYLQIAKSNADTVHIVRLNEEGEDRVVSVYMRRWF